MKKVIASILLFTIIFTILLLPGICSPNNQYWPTDQWRTSTPEKQGIDSAKLVNLFRLIETQSEIRSLLIIRHGYLVAEGYRNPYDKDSIVNIKSVTKSFLSALTGIALREKYILSIDDRVSDYLPEYFNESTDPAKKEVTLRQLLTMTAGFQNTNDNTPQWSRSADWVKYVIDQALVNKPGTTYNYNDGLPHLMSAIITRTSGLSTLEFGQKYLFDPLEISVKKWTRDTRGIYIGGCELSLTPRDMAKFGYLYLNNGVWQGEQLIPETWVRESTKYQAKPTKPLFDYGFWWWLTPDDYQAHGWGGQYIIVNPKLDLVVIITAADFHKPLSFLKNFIYPAVKSKTPLPPNPQAVKEMEILIEKLANPEPNPIKPTPEILKKVNGATYYCERNPLGLTSFTFTWEKNNCSFKFQQTKHTEVVPIGLNGKYKVVSFENNPTYFGSRPYLPINRSGGMDHFQIAFKGEWVDEHSFLVEWMNYLEEPVRFLARFSFEGDKVEIWITMRPASWGKSFGIKGYCLND